jgi:non-ribosomal peptide synthetase component F
MPLLSEAAARHPHKPAALFPDTGEGLSFGELDSAANRAANGFVSLGLAPGEGVALLLENGPDFLVLSYGAKRAGLMVTPLSIHLRPREVAHVLADSGARALVASASLAELAARSTWPMCRIATPPAGRCRASRRWTGCRPVSPTIGRPGSGRWGVSSCIRRARRGYPRASGGRQFPSPIG